MLALGVAGGRVILVDEASGEVRWAVHAHAGGYSSTHVAMSPNGRFVASVGADGQHWTLWDAASWPAHRVGARHDGTGDCICRSSQEGCPVVAHTAGLRALAFSPCGDRLASGGDEGAVILWDAQTGKAEHRMQGHRHGVCSISFSANGARLACGSGDGSVRVWDAGGALFRTIPRHSSVYSMVHFSPTNSRTLASVGHDLIRLWDVDSGEMIRSFAARVFPSFSPDGRTIATASDSGARDVLLVHVESGELRLRLVSHQSFVSSASFSLDGSKLASGSFDGTCKVWDSSTGALLRTIEVGEMICSVTWGRDWVRDTQRAMAFAMGHHPRLGAESRVLGLETGVVRMILDRAC